MMMMMMIMTMMMKCDKESSFSHTRLSFICMHRRSVVHLFLLRLDQCVARLATPTRARGSVLVHQPRQGHGNALAHHDAALEIVARCAFAQFLFHALASSRLGAGACGMRVDNCAMMMMMMMTTTKFTHPSILFTHRTASWWDGVAI